MFGIEDAGRWTLVRQGAAIASAPVATPAETLEHVARTLLRRHGVVCWRLLEREAAWLPTWRELVRVWRRLEARGEIRGGRFIAGLSGEQYALPDAIALLRQVRRRPHDGEMIVLSAADPANMLGTVLQGAKVARISGARVLYRDGLAIGTNIAGQIELLAPLAPAERRTATRLLGLDPGVRFLEHQLADAVASAGDATTQ
jgi:ATP-dependent Lhr-like helicase